MIRISALTVLCFIFQRMIGIVALTVVCFTFQSSVTRATITVPYMKGMRLGDSFDYSTFKRGNNLIQSDIRDKAVERRNDRSHMKFKLIKSQKDVRDVLDVSGELSVKVMAGLVDVQGKGAYLKSSVKSDNSVELLVQIYYRTATKTITDDVMKPMPNWKEKVDGETHYIRGITYGGYLIVSMKFTAKEDKNIEDIKAEIEVHVNTKKVNVGVKGQFKSLSEAAASSSNLEISFTSSSIPNVMPLDLDTILRTIGDFPAKIKESKNGLGVPIEVEIRELKYLQGSEEQTSILNSLIAGKIERFESMFGDLHSTFLAIGDLVTDPKHETMSDRVANKYGELRTKIKNIRNVFYESMGKVNLNDGSNMDELNKAFEAYVGEDKGFVPGKYARQLKRLQINVPLPVSWESKSKKKQKEAENGKLKEEMNKTLAQLNEKISPFEDLLLDNNVAVSFHRQSVKAYIIDKGAPEMESVMGCFSAKMNAGKRFLDVISYATTTSNFKFRVSYHSGYVHLVISDKNSPLNKHWSGPTGELDGQWHTLCVSWDVNVKVRMFKDGRKILSKAFSKMPKIPGGGTWVIGQEQGDVGREFDKSGSFTGEIRNVNIYANFDKKLFRRVGGGITSNTCQRKYSKYILKSWEDLKTGFVGSYKKMVKNSPCLN